ncbi:MAG: 3'-5' exonuclease [Pseudomonadota bacterium]|nr:3'-5' exonuclease [Pseudomonadota bacterium]
MAQFPQVFSRIEKRCENPGERLVLAQLRRCLSDDYTVWHDLPVGPLQRQPDFVVFNPRRGVLVLEVKHWKLASLARATKSEVTLALEGGPKSVKHPEVQARECALQINNVLERDPQLKQTEGRYIGRCAVPYGWGVVMSGIRRAQVQGLDFDSAFAATRTLLRDELDEGVPPDQFQERLWGLFTAFVPAALTLPQQDRVRWHMFPDVRISNLSAAQKAAAEQAGKFAIPDLVQVMDMNQEQAARALGEGHRVIHGAAGSGKTMLLVFRAHHLAQQAQPGEQPVLVLCFNKPLADRIRQQLQARDVQPARVVVDTFHGWCEEMVRSYQLPRPAGLSGTAYFEALANTVERALQHGQVPSGQYSALLIDEAHDFDAAWLRIATQLVNPATRSLLVLYDDAQSIYKPAAKRFSFASVGIQAQGRTSILRLNYRNTVEILALAMRCAEQLLTEASESDTQMQRVCPATAGRRGPLPQLLRFGSTQHEAKALAERIAQLLEGGVPADDVAVLAATHASLHDMHDALRSQGVAAQLRKGRDGKLRDIDWQQPGVKLLTMHAAKGLEFPHVILMRLNQKIPATDSLDEQLRVLYVAMTRATHQLTLSCTGDAPLVARIQNALDAVGEDLP